MLILIVSCTRYQVLILTVCTSTRLTFVRKKATGINSLVPLLIVYTSYIVVQFGNATYRYQPQHMQVYFGTPSVLRAASTRSMSISTEPSRHTAGILSTSSVSPPNALQQYSPTPTIGSFMPTARYTSIAYACCCDLLRPSVVVNRVLRSRYNRDKIAI